jgi:hypothetical protein
MPMKAEQPDIQCPGLTTYEMRFCASQKWDESNQALREQLEPKTLETWVKTTQEVCAAAYAPYLRLISYPQMVVGCDDRLNRVLLEVLKGLGG